MSNFEMFIAPLLIVLMIAVAAGLAVLFIKIVKPKNFDKVDSVVRKIGERSTPVIDDIADSSFNSFYKENKGGLFKKK